MPQNPANVVKKDHSFYEPQLTRHYKKYTPATQPKTCFWLVSEKKHLHWTISRCLRTAFLEHLESECQSICVQTFLFQRRWKLLSGGGRIVSPRHTAVWDLLGNVLRFFYLIEIYKNLTVFRISILPSMALNVLWLSALLLFRLLRFYVEKFFAPENRVPSPHLPYHSVCGPVFTHSHKNGT